VLNNVQKNSPFKKFRFYIVSLQFFHFILLISIRFASDFFLVKQFFGSFTFHLDFFASFCLFHVRFRFRFLLFRFDVKQAKACHFFAFQQNEIFASITIFAYEAKTRAHPTLIKKKIKLSSYIGKFRVEQLQSHIWGRAS